MKELVEYLAKALVDNPEPVKVEEVKENEEFVYKLSVGQSDLGKIIGKKGRTAKALRTLLGAAAAKQKSYASLDILEPDEEQKAAASPSKTTEAESQKSESPAA